MTVKYISLKLVYSVLLSKSNNYGAMSNNFMARIK